MIKSKSMSKTHYLSLLVALAMGLQVGCTTTATGKKTVDVAKLSQAKALIEPVAASAIRRVIQNSPEHAAEIARYAASVAGVFCTMAISNEFAPEFLVAALDKFADPKLAAIGDGYLIDVKNAGVGIYKVLYGDRFRAEIPATNWLHAVCELFCESISQGLSDAGWAGGVKRVSVEVLPDGHQAWSVERGASNGTLALDHDRALDRGFQISDFRFQTLLLPSEVANKSGALDGHDGLTEDRSQGSPRFEGRIKIKEQEQEVLAHGHQVRPHPGPLPQDADHFRKVAARHTRLARGSIVIMGATGAASPANSRIGWVRYGPNGDDARCFRTGHQVQSSKFKVSSCEAIENWELKIENLELPQAATKTKGENDTGDQKVDGVFCEGLRDRLVVEMERSAGSDAIEDRDCEFSVRAELPAGVESKVGGGVARC